LELGISKLIAARVHAYRRKSGTLEQRDWRPNAYSTDEVGEAEFGVATAAVQALVSHWQSSLEPDEFAAITATIAAAGRFVADTSGADAESNGVAATAVAATGVDGNGLQYSCFW